MTEEGWLACTDPQPMLTFLGESDSPSERKWRLFACACCRAVWPLLTDKRSRAAVAVAERLADGETTEGERDRAHQGAEGAQFLIWQKTGLGRGTPLTNEPWSAALLAKLAVAGDPAVYWRGNRDYMISPSRATQAALLRDLVGDSFRPVAFRVPGGPGSRDPAWELARSIAGTIYTDRRFEDLPVLADALEDAGCENDGILTHLRSPGPHVRGCWALDLILGKE